MNNTELNPVKGNILIVDDNPANLRLLSNILNDYGYELRCVTNGQTALTTARWFPPDLILLDIRMPGMDGYEVCSKLKADEKTRDIPVIFISVLSDVLDKVKAFSVGGVDYITKLFEPEEVLARVENQLSIRRLSKQLREQNARLQEEMRVRREAEEKFTRAFRSSPDAIAILTLADGCYIEVNDSFCRISGYSPDEAIGSTLKELNLWVKPQDCLKLKHQLQQTKAIRNWECDFRTKTGKVKTMLISAEIIDLDGQACILAVSKDITERKAAQQALKASEAELRALLAALPDVVLVIDAQGVISKSHLQIHQIYTNQPANYLAKHFTKFLKKSKLIPFLATFAKP
jgi:PAS domain S-box-containing protein